MSYEPTTWVTGDIITATKLNNIESGVQSVSSSYTPTTWATGDIITATKLNNIEQGIANAGGGSSDFSTAQVTVVNNMDGLISANNMIRISDGYMAAAGMIRTGTANITAVLYKNMARWIVSTGTVTATGNATIETAPSGTAVIITGDCTITIS